jgi:DNA-binding GntR family transcriptional regulator
MSVSGSSTALIRRASTCGWISWRPNSGSASRRCGRRSSNYAPKGCWLSDLADVANLQAHVGGELAARAAVNIDDDQLRELKGIQADLEEAYAGNDIERTVRLNHEFHRAINVAAESPKLAQMMSQITRYAPESVFPTIAGWPGQSIKDHRRVVAALAKHDSELARKAMSDHLAAGAAPLIDHLAEHGVVDNG